MLDYFKKRIDLDFQFLSDYWWVFVLMVVLFIVILGLINHKGR